MIRYFEGTSGQKIKAACYVSVCRHRQHFSSIKQQRLSRHRSRPLSCVIQILRSSLNFPLRFYALLLVFTVCLLPPSCLSFPYFFVHVQKLRRPFEVYRNVLQTPVCSVVASNGNEKSIPFPERRELPFYVQK